MDNEVRESIEKIKRALRKAVDENNYVDVGAGAATNLGVRQVRFRVAVQSLVQDEGYAKHYVIKVEQSGTGDLASLKVLAPKGATYRDVYENLDKVIKLESLD